MLEGDSLQLIEIEKSFELPDLWLDANCAVRPCLEEPVYDITSEHLIAETERALIKLDASECLQNVIFNNLVTAKEIVICFENGIPSFHQVLKSSSKANLIILSPEGVIFESVITENIAKLSFIGSTCSGQSNDEEMNSLVFINNLQTQSLEIKSAKLLLKGSIVVYEDITLNFVGIGIKGKFNLDTKQLEYLNGDTITIHDKSKVGIGLSLCGEIFSKDLIIESENNLLINTQDRYSIEGIFKINVEKDIKVIKAFFADMKLVVSLTCNNLENYGPLYFYNNNNGISGVTLINVANNFIIKDSLISSTITSVIVGQDLTFDCRTSCYIHSDSTLIMSFLTMKSPKELKDLKYQGNISILGEDNISIDKTSILKGSRLSIEVDMTTEVKTTASVPKAATIEVELNKITANWTEEKKKFILSIAELIKQEASNPYILSKIEAIDSAEEGSNLLRTLRAVFTAESLYDKLTFDEINTEHFSLQDAFALLKVSKVVNYNEIIIQKCAEYWGFSIQIFKSNKGVKLALFQDATSLIIAASNILYNNINILEGTKHRLVPMQGYDETITIYKEYNDIVDDLWRNSRPNTLKQALFQANMDICNKIIWFTGHSIGGAIATVLLAKLLDKCPDTYMRWRLYTFGSPRVGNTSFIEMMNDKTKAAYNIVNECDPVTVAPVAAFDYHLIGQLWYFDNQAICIVIAKSFKIKVIFIK